MAQKELLENLESRNIHDEEKEEHHASRDMQAFAIFKMKELTKYQPGSQHITGLSRKISKKWKSLSDTEKQPYLEEADKTIHEYKEKNKDCQLSKKQKRASHNLPTGKAGSESTTQHAESASASTSSSSVQTGCRSNPLEEPPEYISTDFEELLTPLP